MSHEKSVEGDIIEVELIICVFRFDTPLFYKRLNVVVPGI
jgi:hypothetical protein